MRDGVTVEVLAADQTRLEAVAGRMVEQNSMSKKTFGNSFHGKALLFDIL